MAFIGKCQFCGNSTINTSMHPECRAVVNEDLLHRINTHISKHPGKSLSISLISELTTGNFQSLKEWEKARSSHRMLQRKQEQWQEAKNCYVAKAEEEFNAKYPEPNPPMC